MAEPYYQDERLCECGCGTPVRRRFVSGHNTRGMERTERWRANQREGLRRAWATKRERMPIGSTRIDSHGYRLIKTREHGGRWDKEHVLIAEREIGRALKADEHVHHINGRKLDNRPENLVVLNRGDHSAAHWSLNTLVGNLLEDRIIEFDRATGVYRRV